MQTGNWKILSVPTNVGKLPRLPEGSVRRLAYRGDSTSTLVVFKVRNLMDSANSKAAFNQPSGCRFVCSRVVPSLSLSFSQERNFDVESNGWPSYRVILLTILSKRNTEKKKGGKNRRVLYLTVNPEAQSESKLDRIPLEVIADTSTDGTGVRRG